MSRFLVDAQLPPILAQWLRALKTGAAIITKDEGFSNRSVLANVASTIVWIRLGNCRNMALIAAIDRAMSTVEQSIAAGDRVIELI